MNPYHQEIIRIGIKFNLDSNIIKMIRNYNKYKCCYQCDKYYDHDLGHSFCYKCRKCFDYNMNHLYCYDCRKIY